MQAILEISNLQIDLNRLSLGESAVLLPDLLIPEEVKIYSDQEIEEIGQAAKALGMSHAPDDIYWRFGRDPHLATSVKDCLSAFIKLAYTDRHGVVEFVRRWGPLHFHYLTKTDTDDIENFDSHVWQYEPIAIYQRTAKQYEAILHTAANLHNEQSVSLELWRWVLWPFELRQRDWPALRADISFQKSLLAAILNGIIGRVEITPFFRWKTERLVLALGTENAASLFLGDVDEFEADRENKSETHVRTVLAMQLAAAVLSPYGIWKCDVCGNFYNPPNRKGRGDGQHLCSAECRNARRREVAREYQQRRRKKE